MELIQMPAAMRNRGFTGWPQVYRVSKNEESPPVGVPYVIAEAVDFALVFRLMVPNLMKQHPYFDWKAIFNSLTNQSYYEQRVYLNADPGFRGDDVSAEYSGSSLEPETMTIGQLASDEATYVDLDMLTDLGMMPAFMTDIREAITVNVTNSYMWNDGYNKKTGVCTGYLTEQPKPRSLIILDISASIPDGVSAGMLTMVKTITEVANADLIITGGSSYFYSYDEVRDMDIREVRRKISRSNESYMFNQILATHDMEYENVITFGDSDTPSHHGLKRNLNIKRWYSFFTMDRDTYGNSYQYGCGYGKWIKDFSPNVQIIHNTEWAKFFQRWSVQGW